MALTFALQGACIVSTFLAGWALGLVGTDPRGAASVYLAYLPICYLAGALPIGVMENVFNTLFVDAAGMGTTEAALSLSLFTRLVQVIWALPGAWVLLQSRPDAGALRTFRNADTEPTPGP